MPFLITALTRSATLNKTTGEKINNKIRKMKKTYFSSKLKHLIRKAPSYNVNIQSEENLKGQVDFFVNTKHSGLYFNETK